MSDPPGGPVSCNVSMVGLYGVGKTSLVRRYVHSIYSENYLPTIGVQISRKRVTASGRDVDFNLWDLEGKDDRRQLQETYLQHAQACILVADVTRRASLDTALELQAAIRKLLPAAPFVLALNKSDLASEIEAELARLDKTWTIVRTSARTGKGVDAIFSFLADRLLIPRDDLDDIGDVHRDEPERYVDEPSEKLEIFRALPAELRVEASQPIEVAAGSREVRIGVSLRGGVVLGTPPKLLVSCACPRRKDVRCLVARSEDPDTIEAVIDLPEGLSAGDEINCEIRSFGDGVRTKAITLAIV